MDITSARPDALHPVSAHERIDLIDVVRGFALFGVLHLVLLWYGDIVDVRLSQGRKN